MDQSRTEILESDRIGPKLNLPGIDKLIIWLLSFQIRVPDSDKSSVGLLNNLKSLLVEFRKEIGCIERLIQWTNLVQLKNKNFLRTTTKLRTAGEWIGSWPEIDRKWTETYQNILLTWNWHLLVRIVASWTHSWTDIWRLCPCFGLGRGVIHFWNVHFEVVHEFLFILTSKSIFQTVQIWTELIQHF